MTAMPPDPESQMPWQYREQNVDDQLADAVDKLKKAKEEKEVVRADMLPRPPSGGSSRGGKAHRKMIAERAAANLQVKKYFMPDKDPRYEEMVAFSAELPVVEEKVHTSKRNPLGDSWVAEFRISLDTMLSQLSMTFEPKIGEEQLARIYEWFQIHKCGLEDHGRPSSARRASEELNYLEVEAGGQKHQKGSAFYVPTDRYGSLGEQEEEADIERQVTCMSAADEGDMAGRLTNAKLPPPRERLRAFETKQLVTPLSARKMKAAAAYTTDDCQSPEPTDRSHTPSTCTGGSYSVRSFSARSTPLPPSSRSSPTPLGGSRPSSARPSSAAGPSRRPQTPGRPQTPQGLGDSIPRPPQAPRPGTAPRMGTRPPSMPSSARGSRTDTRSSGVAASAEKEFHLREALEQETADRQMATAQQNMEERWLMRRHRDIANQMIDEDRHAAVAAWAERRARVEEEIAYNAEAMRFQSELWQRAVTMPADALEDIAPTEPLDEEVGDEPGTGNANIRSSLKRASMLRASPRMAPSRYDVSQITGEDHQVLFATESAQSQRLVGASSALTNRIASLRLIHKHLLKASDIADGDDTFGEEGSDGCPDSIFQTEIGANHISLSVYTADSTQTTACIRNTDDADIVAAVCDRWSGRELALGVATETGETLHELRFKQQKEAETVKRVLARRNCPFSAAVVENALVMPPHLIKPEACVFNMEPNLKTEGMPTWYAQDLLKKKKGPVRRTAKRSSTASRKSSPRPKKR